MRYKIDENTIWEDTGKIRIHNYPPSSKHTYSYVTRVYREYKSEKIVGWKKAEGEAIYFHDMTNEQIVLAKIMAECENALNNVLKHNKLFIPINDQNV
jgi:hypothetical protein